MEKDSLIKVIKNISDIDNNLLGYNKNGIILTSFDWKEISSSDLFIKSMYKQLNCPNDLWLNWDAFWDTIRDSEFFVKKPLIIILYNYNNLFWINHKDRYILSDLLINMLLLNNQKYYIFILKK